MGLDPLFLSILEEDLLSILNEGFRPSVLNEMQLLDQELKRDDLTTEERANIKKAFDKVSSQKDVEVTEKNIKAVIEDLLNKGAYSIERERGSITSNSRRGNHPLGMLLDFYSDYHHIIHLICI